MWSLKVVKLKSQRGFDYLEKVIKRETIQRRNRGDSSNHDCHLIQLFQTPLLTITQMGSEVENSVQRDIFVDYGIQIPAKT